MYTTESKICELYVSTYDVNKITYHSSESLSLAYSIFKTAFETIGIILMGQNWISSTAGSMKSYPGSGRGVEYLVYYLVMKQGVGDEVCC